MGLEQKELWQINKLNSPQIKLKRAQELATVLKHLTKNWNSEDEIRIIEREINDVIQYNNEIDRWKGIETVSDAEKLISAVELALLENWEVEDDKKDKPFELDWKDIIFNKKWSYDRTIIKDWSMYDVYFLNTIYRANINESDFISVINKIWDFNIKTKKKVFNILTDNINNIKFDRFDNIKKWLSLAVELDNIEVFSILCDKTKSINIDKKDIANYTEVLFKLWDKWDKFLNHFINTHLDEELYNELRSMIRNHILKLRKNSDNEVDQKLSDWISFQTKIINDIENVRQKEFDDNLKKAKERIDMQIGYNVNITSIGDHISFIFESIKWDKEAQNKLVGLISTILLDQSTHTESHIINILSGLWDNKETIDKLVKKLNTTYSSNEFKQWLSNNTNWKQN